MEDCISYEDIHKHFGKNMVLDGVTLSIYKGETLVILGGSGCGKSVLLKTTIGILKPNSGRVIIDGIDISSHSERDLIPIRRKVSYMFQWGALFDSMSVYENLAFPLREHFNLSEEEIGEKVKEKLSLVDLEGVEELYPADLSGGMKKRVALARSIITEPACILYDEPTSGLDPVTADTINRLIRRMQEVLKITSVVVTHDLTSMKFVADRVAYLYEGKMAFVGSLEEAYNSSHPAFKCFLEGRSSHA